MEKIIKQNDAFLKRLILRFFKSYLDTSENSLDQRYLREIPSSNIKIQSQNEERFVKEQKNFVIKQKVLAKILTDGLKTTLSPEVSENSRTITVFTSTSSIPTIEFESKKEEIKSFLFFRDNNWLVVGMQAKFKNNRSEVFGKVTHH